MAILDKIAKIQDEVGTIPKNGKGPSSKGGFEYVKYEDVARAVRELLVKHKVVVRPLTLQYNSHAEQVGTRMVVNTSILVEYTFTDTEDGSSFTTAFGGEGSDIGGDTATRKAYTQAQKVRDLQTFSIVTGDEPDSDGAEPINLPEKVDPVAKAEATGKETIDSVRARVLDIINDAESPYDGSVVNALGDQIHGHTPTANDHPWANSLPKLKKVYDAMLKGELPA